MQQNCRRVLNLSGHWFFRMVDSFASCWKITLYYAFTLCWKIMLTPSGECPWEGLAIYSCARSAISEGCNIQVWNIQGRNLLTHNVAFVLKPKGLLFRYLPMLWGLIGVGCIVENVSVLLLPCCCCITSAKNTTERAPFGCTAYTLLCHRLRATWK